MKIFTYTLVTITLEVLIWFFRLVWWVLTAIYKLWAVLGGALLWLQRITFILIHKELCKKKKRSEKLKGKEQKVAPLQAKPSATNNIVGGTKTVFLTELPKLRTNEPIRSEPLEEEPAVEVEPDIDPDDIETEDTLSIMEELADDEDIFPPHDGDLPSEDYSTGVTFEQIEETYNTLAKEDSSEEENDAAADVLHAMDGTGLLAFFTLQDKLNERVKTIMKKGMDEKTEKSNFDIRKFVGD